MKRKAAFLLSIIILVAVMLPVNVFAADDNGLEQAIKISKGKFDIPSTFTEFNYNVSTDGDRKVWYLSWSSKDEINGSISVRIDDKGTVLGYNNYSPSDYVSKKILPQISMQEAKTKAEDFINNIDTKILPQVKLLEDNTNSLDGVMESFNYVRLVNGIPFYNNTVNVGINLITGKIQNYNYNWSDDLEFPAADKALSMEQAQKMFKDNLGMKLIYNYTYADSKVKVFPSYTLKYPYNYYLDAVTGEKVQMNPGYDRLAGFNMADQKKALYEAGSKVDVVLTPDELEAVQKVSKLISKEDAEKIARGLKVLELSDEIKLTSANLSRDWQFKDDFTWYLNFQKDGNGSGSDYRNASVSISAVTGEVKNFYNGIGYSQNEKAKYDETASKTAVESFLKDFNKVKFDQTEYDDSEINNNIGFAANEAPTQYSFNYIRKVNGIQFPSNSLRVDYDAVHGKIISYQMTWFDVEFPAVDKVIDADTAYSKLFKDLGLELQYKTRNRIIVYNKISPESNDNAEVKLVYDVSRTKPANFDAYTGAILNYDGSLYKEVKAAEYTDISDHYAKNQINALAKYGISLDGTEFKPDQNIVQKDFFRLLSKAIGNYYSPVTSSDDKDLNQMYAYLIREGILKESEKAPDSYVSREDGIKFMIRALKYDKVADIKGIFKSGFEDEDQMNPDLVGYVTIARGLKLISGNDGYFNPKALLTRAQTAVIIYNYLKN